MKRAVFVAGFAAVILWWAPTIAAGFALLAWRHVTFDARMARVHRLRRAGHYGAAQAALDRLRREIGVS